MHRLCDLHTHSTFSDGTHTPAQIAAKARQAGLGAVALTDHNTVAGLPEFLEAAREAAVEAIPGVEISTGFEGKELHIAGLFIDPGEWEKLTDFLRVINRRKEESNRSLIDSLRRAGYRLDYEEIREHHQGHVNRAVIASEMQKKGYVRDISEAFQGLLSEAHGCYVPPERIPAGEAIRFLRSLRAVPVLAHPFVSMTEVEIRAFIPEAKLCGLAAMETRYSAYSPETTEKAVRIAGEYGLLESGGSDFHGENKPGIQLGTGTGNLEVPFDFVQKLSGLRGAPP